MSIEQGELTINPETIQLQEELQNVPTTENDIVILLKYDEAKNHIIFDIQTSSDSSSGIFIDGRGVSEFTNSLNTILQNHPKIKEISNLYNTYEFKVHENQIPVSKPSMTSRVSSYFSQFGKKSNTGGKKTKSKRSYNSNKTLKNRK